MEKYNHKTIEKKWQEYWKKKKLYKTADDEIKPKYYVLDMFPYPSGDGLHVGHPKGYIATDIFARAKMLKGYNVLHPMGWDAFGLPTENYAIQKKIHPRAATERNIAIFKKQLGLLGFTYDWEREINTTDPGYYKWTQWAFLKMFERGLAYESYEPINWCPGCQTGLSNEDLEDGKCERCGSLVEKKPMRQWMLKITDYAERLLNDLEKLPNWEESIKEMQRNWIGRSEGAIVKFPIPDFQSPIKVFTTRVDTIFGCTYLVLAPEHKLIRNLKLEIGNWDEVEKYINQAKNKTDLERTAEIKEKTGVKLEGVEAINPFNNEAVPIFVADYVLAGYGTGAVMAVPAHDFRDFDFAERYKLKIKAVVMPKDQTIFSYGGKMPEPEFAKKIISEGLKMAATVNDGILFDSGEYSGLSSEEAREKMTVWLEKNNFGRRAVHYKLKDWVFSRQRYWGEPIPIIHCEACKNRKYNFIFIHGYNSTFNVPWKLWLKRKLEKRGHTVYGPELPNPSRPKIDEQADFIIKNAEINENTIIIGHSLGGTVMMKVLEKIKGQIAQAVFLDTVLRPEFNDEARPAVAASSNWQFNFIKIKKSAKEFTVLADKNFPIIPKSQTEELGNIFNARILYVAPNHRHFSQAETEPAVLQLFENTGLIPVPEKDLPLKLPEVKNYEPTGTGESPLANIKEWVNTKCPKCGGRALRETNTMPQWAGSSWYYLRYIDPKNKKALVDKAKEKYWSPVDFYVGGAEHATRHLIYARFWHKFLFDIGAVNYDEPFKRLEHVGLILAEDGRKMSKRWHNVINPDDIVAKHGADALRVYEMFMGPFNQPCAWSTNGLVGARRFLEKIWAFYHKVKLFDCQGAGCRKAPEGLPKLMHKTVKKVTEDIESFRFNTAISQMMIFMNFASRLEAMPRGAARKFLIILSPFAPHLAEELWLKLGNKQSIFKEKWPEYDPKLAKDQTINLVIQVNGKIRDTVETEADIGEAEAKKLALENEKIKKWLMGKEVLKVIFVKGKLVNIVIK